MKFSHNMEEWCTFCFKKLYTGKCQCEKSKLEENMLLEIEEATNSITARYKLEHEVFEDKVAIREFKDANVKHFPSYY